MKTRSLPQTALLYFLAALVLAAVLIPVGWFLLLALRPPETSFSVPPVAIFEPRLDSFQYTFGDPGQNVSQLRSSIFVATGAVLLNLPFALPAAYALSRYRMRAKKPLMLWYISLLMAPAIVFVIPYFIFMSNLGLRGTYPAMIITLQTITIPFSVWLMKSFFDEVPVDLEEAAKVDGASLRQIMLKVTVPLAMPGVIVTSLFAFVFSWNNVIIPIALSSQQTATLPVGTMSYMANTGVVWSWIAATAVVTMIPPMLIFIVLDRWVVRGLTFGAVKG